MAMRSLRVHFRLTGKEGERLGKMEEVTGHSAGFLFKNALFSREDLEQPLLMPDQFHKLMVEINRQGNNLNQLARKVNEGVRSGWNEAFNSLTRGYMDIRRLVSVGYGRS